MIEIDFWTVFIHAENVFGILYCLLIAFGAYMMATDQKPVHKNSYVVMPIIALTVLPVFATSSFVFYFFRNTEPEYYFHLYNSKIYLDELKLFDKIEQVSKIEILIFFVDQAMGAIFRRL